MWARHLDCHQALISSLETLGLRPVVNPAHRLPQLAAVPAPDDIDDARARTALVREHALEIGGGLGDFAGRVWRIGMMGQNASRASAALVARALGDVIAAQRSPDRAASTT